MFFLRQLKRFNLLKTRMVHGHHWVFAGGCGPSGPRPPAQKQLLPVVSWSHKPSPSPPRTQTLHPQDICTVVSHHRNRCTYVCVLTSLSYLFILFIFNLTLFYFILLYSHIAPNTKINSSMCNTRGNKRLLIVIEQTRLFSVQLPRPKNMLTGLKRHNTLPPLLFPGHHYVCVCLMDGLP